MQKKISSLSIDRNMWLCDTNAKKAKRPESETPTSSELLADDGMKCCLGFLAEACGVPKHKLLGVGDFTSERYFPLPFEDEIPEEFRYVQNNDKSLHDRAIALNDAPRMSTKRREERLKKIFAEGGIRLSFRGKYR